MVVEVVVGVLRSQAVFLLHLAPSGWPSSPQGRTFESRWSSQQTWLVTGWRSTRNWIRIPVPLKAGVLTSAIVPALCGKYHQINLCSPITHQCCLVPTSSTSRTPGRSSPLIWWPDHTPTKIPPGSWSIYYCIKTHFMLCLLVSVEFHKFWCLKAGGQ